MLFLFFGISFVQTILIVLKSLDVLTFSWGCILLPFAAVNVFLITKLVRAFFSKDIDAKKYRSSMLEKYSK